MGNVTNVSYLQCSRVLSVTRAGLTSELSVSMDLSISYSCLFVRLLDLEYFYGILIDYNFQRQTR